MSQSKPSDPPPPLPDDVLGKSPESSEIPEEDDPRIIFVEGADDEGPQMPPETDFIAAPPLSEIPDDEDDFIKRRKVVRGKSKTHLRETKRAASFSEDSAASSPIPEKKHRKKSDAGTPGPDGTAEGHHHHHKKKKPGDADGSVTPRHSKKKSVHIQPPPGEGAGSNAANQAAGDSASNQSKESGESQSSSSSSSSDEESSDTSSVGAGSTPILPKIPKGFSTLNLGDLSSPDKRGISQRHSSMKNMLSSSSPASDRTPIRPGLSPSVSMHIRSRTFSEIGEEPLKKISVDIPVTQFVTANSKLVVARIAGEIKAERTPKATFQDQYQASPHRKLTRQVIFDTKNAKAVAAAQLAKAQGAAKAQSAANLAQAPPLPSIGVITAMTDDQKKQYEVQLEEFRKSHSGQKKRFGGSVEEQALQPGHDANPDVPPFFISLMTKLKSFGVKADERSLLMLWELDMNKPVPKDVLAEKEQLESGRLRVEQMVIESHHVIYLILEYLNSLSTPLIGYDAQSVILPFALSEYDDLELAAALLPGLWSLTKCEYETLKYFVLTLRELYITPSKKAMSAAFNISSVIAGALFQATTKFDKVKRAFARLVSCLLFNGGDLFNAPPQVAFENAPTQAGDLFLQAAAPPFLIETLTNEFYEESNFSYLFLLTYQYYMTHEELYSILVTHCKKMFDCREQSVWRDRKKALILSVIGRWVRVRGSELLVDAPDVVDLLKSQFGTVPVTEKMSIAQFFKEASGHVPSVVFFAKQGSEASSDLLLMQMKKDKDLRHLAEQICLFHQTLFSFIPISELIKKKKLDPDVSDSDIFTASFVTSFNKLTKWLISQIVKCEKDEVVELLSSSIKLAKELLALNNFNGAMAISTALQHPKVERIHEAWDRVPRKLIAQMDQLKELFNLTFSNYRTRIVSCEPPGVPCLVVIQHDLFGLEENARTWFPEKGVPNAMINFDKLRKIGEMLQQVKLFQLTPYSFKPVAGTQEALKNLPVLDDDAIYGKKKLSASAPPRT